ncbi:MAG: class B sortase [Coriobacteriales bacterium]|nr:class B sortase [Coriobacteriales bacterium]
MGQKNGMRPVRAALRVAHNLVNILVLAIVLLLFAIGGFALWDSGRIYQEASSERYEMYKPASQEGTLSFAQLQQINPDVFGWLTVHGTNIDYPLVQGPDNIKYVNTSAKGDYSLSGALFLDSNNQRDLTDFANIIHGHNMDKNVMFGEIGLFADKTWFSERRYGSLLLNGREYGLEFFAFLQADAYDDTVFRAGTFERTQREAYLELLRGQALQSRAVTVTTDDRIVLLSTCTPNLTNRRDILVAKITDETFVNAFTKDIGSSPVPDALAGTGGLVLLWVALLFLGVAAVIVLVVVRRRKDKKTTEKKTTESGEENE